VSFSRVQPTLVKYEMRMVQGQDPRVREQRKPGFFGRLLSGMGRVLGAVAAPLSFVFPPAAIAAAGMYGLGKVGDQMQVSAYMKMVEKQQQAAMPVAYPGMEIGGGQTTPASFDVSAQDARVMDVLFSRGNAQTGMTNGMTSI
jgi:hypothetical protein